MFFTDSFHGCAFAILMETQFVICDRKVIDVKQKMNSRLDSLMTILDIQGRKLNDFVISPTEIDYAMPEELASLAVFMVSGAGDMIVGDTFYMTGGSGTITLHH